MMSGFFYTIIVWVVSIFDEEWGLLSLHLNHSNGL